MKSQTRTPTQAHHSRMAVSLETQLLGLDVYPVSLLKQKQIKLFTERFKEEKIYASTPKILLESISWKNYSHRLSVTSI